MHTIIGRRRVVGACLALTTALLAVPADVGASLSPARSAAPNALGQQAALASPDAALGAGWRSSSDVLVTGVGDTAGFHLYVAREREAFGWSTLATLTASALDIGPWTGQVCVTGSGRYAVVVYAPAMVTNRPSQMEAGAMAAVVDTTSGQAREVATGVQLAYFDPACGPGERAMLTRAVGSDEQQTDLLTVDAAAARVTDTRRIDAQLTTPAPALDGDYGIAHGKLVRVDRTGALTTLARPVGRPFAVQATAGDGIDVVSVSGQRAVAQRFAQGILSDLGSGQWDRLQLFGLAGGRDALVGDVAAIREAMPGLTTLAADRQVKAISGQGHLLAVETLTRQAAHIVGAPLARPNRALAGSMQVTVRATHSGRTATGTVTTTHAPTLDGLTQQGPAAARGEAPLLDPPDVPTPVCAIPRNDPQVQAFQPSPNMVEWAVDQAVHGRLDVQRPANYLKTGQGAYTPQEMFPLSHLDGGGSVPSQVMLGILAQETNLSEASWHAVPGDDGNPLIADYYGNGNANLDLIDYADSDCGYGIGQVTDGMHSGQINYNHAQQVAIATDYAANIAAALNILIDKWNQLQIDGPSFVNNGDPARIENWYLAVWSYNSGYHFSSDAADSHGAWGVGYLNNPANPHYPANRDPFLRDTYADAAEPGKWTYEEKVMGWIESPQKKGSGDAYAAPSFGSNAGGRLTLPDLRTFCTLVVNDCDPALDGDPCLAVDDYCWWHGTSAAFADCLDGECASEFLRFSLGTSEPGVQRVYDRDCETFTGYGDPYRDLTRPVVVVYDLNDPSQYALGCSVGPSGGKFTLRLGYPPGNDPAALYSQIDLHQLGAGYNGHIWFTHVYPPSSPGVGYNTNHQVTATWTPELGLAKGTRQYYDILVHLPSHGGEYTTAEYDVFPDTSDGTSNGNNGDQPCQIDQGTGTILTNGTDKWVHIGNYQLSRGARVELNNVGDGLADGTTDIAFDAMAFVPAVPSPGSHCRDPYPN